jgi:hypothetical protein
MGEVWGIGIERMWRERVCKGGRESEKRGMRTGKGECE